MGVQRKRKQICTEVYTMFKLRFTAALHSGSSNPQVLGVRSKNSRSEFDFSVALLTIKRYSIQSLQGLLSLLHQRKQRPVRQATLEFLKMLFIEKLTVKYSGNVFRLSVGQLVRQSTKLKTKLFHQVLNRFPWNVVLKVMAPRQCFWMTNGDLADQ